MSDTYYICRLSIISPPFILVKNVYVPFDRFLSSLKCLEICLVGACSFGSWDFISSRGTVVSFSDISSQLITYLTSFQVYKKTMEFAQLYIFLELKTRKRVTRYSASHIILQYL